MLTKCVISQLTVRNRQLGDDRRLTVSGATQIRFDDIAKNVKQYMSHPYLQACHIRQSVSHFHFDVAHVILQVAHVPVEKMKLILESVLLLEQGLSIHDDVDEAENVQRQLTVLSGDYNSSHYYFVLSQLEDASLLHVLSEAVARINEAKMTLVRHTGSLRPDEYMALYEEVNGALLHALATYYLGHANAEFPQIAPLIRAYVLGEEMKNPRNTRLFTFRQSYEWLSECMERAVGLPANAILGPISTLVMEYLTPLRARFESLNLAEGNRG